MLSVLAILCPPLAVLLTASPLAFVKNCGLTSLLFVPGVLHARGVVEQYSASRRYDVLMKLLEERDAGPPARTRAA